MSVTHVVATRNTLCNAVVDQLNSGFVKIMEADNDEVATLTFGATAFDEAGSAGGNADGVAAANAITADATATGGIAAKAALQTSAAADVVNCSVTATGGGGDIELSSATIGAGAEVSLSSLSYEAAP